MCCALCVCVCVCVLGCCAVVLLCCGRSHSTWAKISVKIGDVDTFGRFGQIWIDLARFGLKVVRNRTLLINCPCSVPLTAPQTLRPLRVFYHIAATSSSSSSSSSTPSSSPRVSLLLHSLAHRRPFPRFSNEYPLPVEDRARLVPEQPAPSCTPARPHNEDQSARDSLSSLSHR